MKEGHILHGHVNVMAGMQRVVFVLLFFLYESFYVVSQSRVEESARLKIMNEK